MFGYIIRRLINVIFTLVVISIVTFAVFFMVPKLTGTDPAFMYLGKNAADAAAVAGTRKKMGFDKPIPVQYGLFVKGLVAGRDYENGPDVQHCPAPCFGYSFKDDRPIWPILTKAMPVTASLAAGAAIIWLTFGVLTGMVSALRRGTFIDRAAMTTALAGVSLPIYFTGLVALAIFAHQLPWFRGADYQSLTTDPAAWFRSLVLPWITLAFLFAATYARLTRATMLEVMNEDYIRTARAKGLGETKVVTRHAFRSTLTPIVTVFGLDLGTLMGGAVLTERVFNLRGLGYEALRGISGNDLPLILGVTLFAGFFIVVANLLVDLAYAAIDPRVRLG
jgi:peptide/nickel transport system permease protein